MISDFPFGPLIAAWQSAGTVGGASLPREGGRAAKGRASLVNAARRDCVLWLRASDGSTPPSTVKSLEARGDFRIHAIDTVLPTGVESLLHERRPQLLVADVRWCETVGPGTVRRLHRCAPQVDWLLCWDEPSPRWLEMLVLSGARGAVRRDADPDDLARALDAVVAGELWLPRRVLQWLYASMIDAPVQDARPSTPASLWPGDGQLTPREAEVADLLRHGLTNREIGERLGVSINTVKKHVASAFEKRGIRSRRQTIA